MKKRYSLLLIGIIFVSCTYVSSLDLFTGDYPYFTLVFKTSSGGVRPDYGYLLRDQLARIGIELEVFILDWPTMVGELLVFRDFDIFYVDLTGGQIGSPDYSGLYEVGGPMNMFGYDPTLDWDEELGMGKNEWYIKHGATIMPPNSEERIQHYWEWENYLMDEILPMQPTFTPKTYKAYWETLEGYNYSKGLVQSWGNMYWDSAHTGQLSTNEIVIHDSDWVDLNPLFYHDSPSDFVVRACYEPLFWIDVDQTVWPHLAESFEMINDTMVRITARQGIKWQNDSSGLFTNEYFDIQDVYFTLYCWKEVSNDQHMWDWIEDMEIIDQWTMDIYIDGYPGTPVNEPYAPFLLALNNIILPEHYLNQTQLPDGKTPDITNPAWNSLATECIGTGLFTLENHTEGFETNLEVYSDCWWLNETITNNTNLNWNVRFGDFSANLDRLRIRTITNQQTALSEFESGKIDLIGVPSSIYDDIIDFCCFDYEFQSKLIHTLGFFGYNLRESRPVIGMREPGMCDPSISRGLALRKAISYAMNREEINRIVHGGEYEIVNHPIYPTEGIWCNPDIIVYEHSLYEAEKYMAKCGWDLPCTWTPTSDVTFIIYIGSILFVVTATAWLIRVRKRRLIR